MPFDISKISVTLLGKRLVPPAYDLNIVTGDMLKLTSTLSSSIFRYAKIMHEMLGVLTHSIGNRMEVMHRAPDGGDTKGFWGTLVCECLGSHRFQVSTATY